MFPTLFRIGPIEIHTWGTLLMFGFLAGILVARRESRRLGIPPDVALDLGLWVLVSGVLFARAVFVALNWSDFAARPADALYIWREGGLSFHGGLGGGIIAGAVFSKWRRIPFWSLADLTAPGLALGYAIARIGCFLNGCCYGAPTALPWGVRFPLYPDSQITTEPSHPTQLYATLGSLAIFAVLLLVRNRLSARGQLFLLYLALYAIMRSGLEVLRKGYSARILVDGITQGQFVSALIFVIAVVGMVVAHRRRGAGDSAEPASGNRA